MDFQYHIIGDLLISSALAMTVLSAVSFFLVARGNSSFEFLAQRSYHLFAIFVGLAVVLLYYLFFSHNYYFRYVYDYNELTQPWEYIISGFWGGQEGTYLLWAALNALFGYILLKKSGIYRNWAMVVFCGINMFYLVIMLRLSPFALLEFWAPDGVGLNPLLRDPWMVIHPPVMFTGYSMAAVPFSIAMAALIQHDYSQWVKRVFPWAAITVFCLSTGNILGGYWAYKTLGWGGYWGWDPVENSSFVPWMVSLALLHGLIIEKRSGAMRKTNLMLTSFVFLLVVYGTYLTRSGVLSDFSVHSFADMGINIYLVVFMFTTLIFAAVAIAWRAGSIPSIPLKYNFYGREFTLLAGVVVLFILGVVVLFWTSLPLLTMAFSDNPRAAEISAYNGFALPLAIVMALLVAMTPLSSHAGYNLENWQKKLGLTFAGSALVNFGLFYGFLGASVIFAGVFTLILTGLIMYLFNPRVKREAWPSLIALVTATAVALISGVEDYTRVLFFAVASMAAMASLTSLATKLKKNWRKAGPQFAHLGFGILLVGVLASSGFVKADKVAINEGAEIEVFDLKVSYWGMENEITTPNNNLRLTIDDDGDETEGNPELYYSARMDGIMRKPFIKRSLGGDMYFAPAQIQQAEKDGFVLKKGETKHFQDFTITLNGFEMGSHGEEAGGMTIKALVAIDSESGMLEVSPVFEYTENPYGESQMEGKLEKFSLGGKDYDLMIEQIYADQGAVVFRMGGLHGETETDRLILDVSSIPLINLVWLGTTFMLFGTLLSFIRRRRESV